MSYHSYAQIQLFYFQKIERVIRAINTRFPYRCALSGLSYGRTQKLVGSFFNRHTVIPHTESTNVFLLPQYRQQTRNICINQQLRNVLNIRSSQCSLCEGLLLFVGAWFQLLFHSPNRGSFHLSLTVLVHYRSSKVFSLGPQQARIHHGQSAPWLLRKDRQTFACAKLKRSRTF